MIIFNSKLFVYQRVSCEFEFPHAFFRGPETALTMPNEVSSCVKIHPSPLNWRVHSWPASLGSLLGRVATWEVAELEMEMFFFKYCYIYYIYIVIYLKGFNYLRSRWVYDAWELFLIVSDF